MDWVIQLGRAAILGLVSFMTPYVLMGAGVPLKSWAFSMGAAIAVPMSAPWAFVLWMFVFLVLYSFIEVRWRLIEKLYGMAARRPSGALPAQQTNTSRHLSTDQKKTFTNALIDKRIDLGEVRILFSVYGGDEAREYAEEFVEVLRTQEWEGDTYSPMGDESQYTGLKLWYETGGGKDPNAALLAEALDEAGIEYEWLPKKPPVKMANLFVYRKG